MKKTILFISALAMTLGFVACSNDDDFVEQTEIIQPQTKKMTICANLDDNLTRTALDKDGSSVVWSAGDKITLTKLNTVGAQPIVFTIKGGVGTTSATFEGDALEDGTYQAIYGDLLVSASQSYDTQKKIADVPMYAKVNVSDGTAENVTFENLCGLLKLTLKSSLSEAVVRSITIDADNSVAGLLNIKTYASDETGLFVGANGYKKGDLQNITIDANSASKTLVYSCGGVQLSSAGTDFYMILPVTRTNRNDAVTSYTKFDIKILFENGYALTKKLNNATLRVGRSKITPVSLTIDKFGDAESHEYVNLELPSGNKWATMNIGATKATEKGSYFAWGEVAPKANYSWGTYEWGSSATAVTKYNSSDSKTTLDITDDAAAVNWGAKWVMPTEDDWSELLNNCYCEYVTSYDNNDGDGEVDIKGYVFYKAIDATDKKQFNITSISNKYRTRKDNGSIFNRKYYITYNAPHIFIPIAGHYENTSTTNDSGSTLYAQYWASTVKSNGNAVQYMERGANKGQIDVILRCYGLTVRPVLKEKK